MVVIWWSPKYSHVTTSAQGLIGLIQDSYKEKPGFNSIHLRFEGNEKRFDENSIFCPRLIHIDER